MKAKGKKFVSLFLIFSLVVLSGNLIAKERRGADLKIQKKDGQQIRGELIVVKKKSLLLMDSESGTDVSVDVGDIRKITIVRKSWTLYGAVIGALVGGIYVLSYGWKELQSEGGSYIGYFAHGGVLGGLVGAVIGTALRLGTDKTIQIEGRSDSEIKEALEKLRKEARVRNFQ